VETNETNATEYFAAWRPGESKVTISAWERVFSSQARHLATTATSWWLWNLFVGEMDAVLPA
jgi:hypothetical protein